MESNRRHPRTTYRIWCPTHTQIRQFKRIWTYCKYLSRIQKSFLCSCSVYSWHRAKFTELLQISNLTERCWPLIWSEEYDWWHFITFIWDQMMDVRWVQKDSFGFLGFFFVWICWLRNMLDYAKCLWHWEHFSTKMVLIWTLRQILYEAVSFSTGTPCHHVLCHITVSACSPPASLQQKFFKKDSIRFYLDILRPTRCWYSAISLPDQEADLWLLKHKQLLPE